MTTSETVAANKALVLKAISGVFIDRNPAVLDELFSVDYRHTIRKSRTVSTPSRDCLGNCPRVLTIRPAW